MEVFSGMAEWCGFISLTRNCVLTGYIPTAPSSRIVQQAMH